MITTETSVKDISEKRGLGFYVFESVSRNQDGQEVARGAWTNIVRGSRGHRNQGHASKYLPHRYAGAGDDFSPIHIDVDFAKSVGLPQNILQGSTRWPRWRGPARARPAATRARFADCRCSSAAWACRELEIHVTGSVSEERDGVTVVQARAKQGDNRIIRNAEAELKPAK